MRIRDVHLASCLSMLLTLDVLGQPARVARTSGSVAGTVVDELGAPIPGVAIRALGGRASAMSTERGYFPMPPLASGTHQIVARRTGYLPDTVQVELTPDDSVALWVVLTRSVVTLDEVVVDAPLVAPRLAAFEARRIHSIGGRFIMPAEFEAQAPTETSDLLRRVLGLRIADSAHVMVPVSNRGYKLAQIGTRLVSVPCVMRIGVNGFIQDSGFSMNSISPNEIHGIEIYNGPSSIPPEFNAGGVDMYCGLIMIWTKTG